MEDIDGGLHPAVDGQSLDEDEDECVRIKGKGKRKESQVKDHKHADPYASHVDKIVV